MTDTTGFVQLNFDPRLWQLAKQMSIQRLEDALVELITNSNDAYTRRGTEQRHFLVRIHGLDAAVVEVIDQATGMSNSQMRNCLMTIGGYSDSTNGATLTGTTRGYFQRGAKDISWLGDVHYHCFKDGLYNALEITTKGTVGFHVEDQPITAELRQQYGVLENGVCVRLEVMPAFRVADVPTLYRNVSNCVNLRDIACSANNTLQGQLLMGGYVVREAQFRYTYPPSVKTVFNKVFTVPRYEGVSASFQLFQTDKALPEPTYESELQFGVLISSGSAIHEATCFKPNWRQHIAMPYLYGRLECTHIMQLMRDLERNGPTLENPFSVLDPARKGGINVDHPFIRQLYSIPMAMIDIYLDKLADELDDAFTVYGDINRLTEHLQVFVSNIVATDQNLMQWFANETGEFVRAIRDINDNYLQQELDDIPLMSQVNNPDQANDRFREGIYPSTVLDLLQSEQSVIVEQGDLEDVPEGTRAVPELFVRAANRKPLFLIKFSNIENPKYQYNVYKTKHEIVMVFHLNNPLVFRYFQPDAEGEVKIGPDNATFIADSISEGLSRILVEVDPDLNNMKYNALTPIENAQQIFSFYERKHQAIDLQVDAEMKKFVS